MASRSRIALFAILAVLGVLTIVVFALSISIFVKLQNNKSSSTGGPPPTDAPTPPASTGAQPTGSGGTTTGATGTYGPTTSSAPLPYSFTSGQLTDETKSWRQVYADPWSSEYSDLAVNYTTAIKTALAASDDKSQYSSAEISITGFSGEYIDIVNKTGTRVNFIIGVNTAIDSFAIGTDLETGGRRAGFSWRSVSTTNSSSLPPLPEARQTAGWKSAAQMFLSSINVSVDPCQDFFRFSCDNYIATHPLGNAPRQSTFDVLQNQIYANLSGVLENLNITAQTSQTVQLVGKMYRACVNVKNDTFNDPSLVLGIASDYGGWPLLDPTWTPDRFGNLMYNVGDMFTRFGVATLFTPSVDINWANVTALQSVFLDQATLAIPADYYKSPNLTQRYQDVLRSTIYQTLQILSAGQKIDNDTVLPQIDRMVQIEVLLADISVNSSLMRNETLLFNPYRLREAKNQFPAIDWVAFFNGSLDTVFPDEDPMKLVEPFILMEPNQYVQSLDTYITDVNLNPDKFKDLVNYLIFRLISPFMQFAGPESAQLFHEFRRQTRLEETDVSDQQSQCVANLVQMIPWGTGQLYINNFFPEINRDDVSVMINNVLSAFSSTLSGLQWMDNISALKAFNKVAGLVRNVAYPDFEQNDMQLDQFYSWWIQHTKYIDDTDPKAYFAYFTVTTYLQGQLIWQDLKVPGDRYDFLMSPAIVNAWYQPERNSISFPAGILNEPFYRYDYPQAVNYGALGVVMGHELSHGFDDQGIQYDYDGTLRTWMTPTAQQGFDKMAQCVVDEYSGFCYPQACINGIATQGENIGDNGGLKAAYRAYQAYKAAHGDEPPLPGMETYSTDQLFFLAFGQVWCGSYSDDALTRQLLTNPHSPGKDRVIGAVQNFPKFGEAFKCKLGDPMYPVSHCDVW